MTHALINSNHASFMTYNGEIESVIVNFQRPGIAPITLSQDEIPAFFKLLTIFASCKISLT